MICVSIGRGRHKHMIAEYQHLAERGAQLVELRLDYIQRAVNLNRILGERPCPVVVTVRRREDGGRWSRSEQERTMLLRSAIAAGVDYVDLEVDVAEEIPRYGSTKRIISYHNFDETPENLAELHREIAEKDPDIVKIATMANSFSDVRRMKQLVENASLPTIGLCMGEIGTLSRILSCRWGSPFTYAPLSSERKLAPGMVGWNELRNVYRFEELTASTDLFGVIADPIAHSHSPIIHNAAFAFDGLDCRYLPLRVPADDLGEFIVACREFGFRGLSVTIPHKESIIQYLSQMEAAADGIGAVNTVIFDGEDLLGYNTDYRAAMDSLSDAFDVSPDAPAPFRGKSALILGAGGVARAVGWGLRQKGAEVLITSRTPERAARLADDIGGKAVPWVERHAVTTDVLINGTPVGMHPDLDRTPYDGSKLYRNTLVFETVYNPEQTLLVKQAREAGCPVITGIDMFVRQAAYQYRLFTGREAPEHVMRLTLKEATSAVKVNM